MKIVFYSPILNNHQACIADELWLFTGHQFVFVELANLHGSHRKGDTKDYRNCSYLVRAWESKTSYDEAMELAKTAECCIFSSIQSLPFQKERMKLGLLSFDMSERWLKKGLMNLLSPNIFKMFIAYWIGGWKYKPIYKLCCSAFAASDHFKLKMYEGKCFKWGYFTKIPNIDFNSNNIREKNVSQLNILWVARFIKWKHPEMMIKLAIELRKYGIDFCIRMIGGGSQYNKVLTMIKKNNLENCVKLLGFMTNDEVYKEMRRHDIFCLTSDRNEGWGAVLNEAMSNACCPVTSSEAGASPFLIQNGINGFMFNLKNKDDFFNKIIWLAKHSNQRVNMSVAAYETMHLLWSPRNAALSLIQLINDLKNAQESSIYTGPCSKITNDKNAEL